METRVLSFGVGRLVAAGVLSVACVFVAPPGPVPAQAADATNLVGMNTSGFSDWGTNKALVDLIKLARPWETMSGGKLRTDANGWPLEDARSIQVDPGVPATPVPAATPVPVETPAPLPTATPAETPMPEPGLAPDEPGATADAP